MKYYILKPQKAPIKDEIMKGICSLDKTAQFTDSIDNCNIVVCQKGWTRSKSAIEDWLKAKELGITIKEGNVFTDKYKVKIN